MRSLYFEDTKEFRPARQINHDALPPYEPFCRRSFTANSLRVFIGWAWDKLFDAEFVRKEGLEFQALRTTNDMYFVFSAIILAERIAVVKKVLAHHRKNVSSSSSIEPYLVAMLIYLLFNGVTERLSRWAEKKLSYYR